MTQVLWELLSQENFKGVCFRALYALRHHHSVVVKFVSDTLEDYHGNIPGGLSIGQFVSKRLYVNASDEFLEADFGGEIKVHLETTVKNLAHRAAQKGKG